MNQAKALQQRRMRRKHRTRTRIILGNSGRPRLSIFRSNTFTSAQLIDDHKAMTIVAASSKELKEKSPKAVLAERVGALLAERALKQGVKSAVVDRGTYRYHGRVKALVEGARKGGLQV